MRTFDTTLLISVSPFTRWDIYSVFPSSSFLSYSDIYYLILQVWSAEGSHWPHLAVCYEYRIPELLKDSKLESEFQQNSWVTPLSMMCEEH